MKNYILYFVCFWKFLIISASPRVVTSFGNITGYYKESYRSIQYEAYEGIPYALPPVGKLRFEPPVPFLPLEEEYFATNLKSSCFQFKIIPYHVLISKTANETDKNTVVGNEDCLYLNVYAPLRSSHNMYFPVVIIFYGGSFASGDVTIITEKYLIDYELVVVTFNFRSGPLGFLSTQDDIVPGNMGLKDQNVAMRWVKNHISHFGGDQNNINLIGSSSGATSVHYHFVSPLSNGLFHGAICLSGSIFSAWTQNQNILEKTKKIASVLGCPTISNQEMINCLKKKPADEITQSLSSLKLWLVHPDIMLGPVVEKKGNNSFINMQPSEIIKSGIVQDVPLIISVVPDEGLWTSADFILHDDLVRQVDKNWTYVVPALLDYAFTIPQFKQDEISLRIRREYFGQFPIDGFNVHNITQMIGDRRFSSSGIIAAQTMASRLKSPIWFFEYSYRGTHSFTEYTSGTNINFGVAHTDDAYLTILYNPLVIPEGEKDFQMQHSLLSTWKTFFYEKKLIVGAKVCPIVDRTMKVLKYCKVYSPENVIIGTSRNFDYSNHLFWISLNFTGNQ